MGYYCRTMRRWVYLFIKNNHSNKQIKNIFRATQFTVQLGSNDLDTKLAVETSSEYMIHPNYNALTLEHDIGLIKIPVTFTLGGIITKNFSIL